MSKYYDGPDGVFYNPERERVFLIKKCHGAGMINIKNGKHLGGVYDYYSADMIRKRTAMLIKRPVIRLGPL